MVVVDEDGVEHRNESGHFEYLASGGACSVSTPRAEVKEGRWSLSLPADATLYLLAAEFGERPAALERLGEEIRVPECGRLDFVARWPPPCSIRVKAAHAGEDFDFERRELVEQASTLRAYADALLAKAPNVAATLETMAKKPGGGRMVLNFTAIVSRLPQFDMATFARQQIPVLTEFAQKTAGISEMAEFHQYYSDNATGMERFLKRI